MTTTLNRPRWWNDYADMLGRPFLDCIAAEADADRICAYDPTTIPGLLQTPEYARLVMTASGATPDIVERGVRLRLARQRILTPSGGVHLDALIDEAALIRAAQIDTGQLAALLGWGRRTYVTVRVVPFTAGPLPAGVPVHLVYRRTGGVLAYSEKPAGSTLSDAHAGWTALFDRLAASAVSEKESAALIRAAAAKV